MKRIPSLELIIEYAYTELTMNNPAILKIKSIDKLCVLWSVSSVKKLQQKQIRSSELPINNTPID